MYLLIDRANGEVISQVRETDFKVLQDNLVRESAEDYDFYINEATLDFLMENGLSGELQQALAAKVQSRGTDVGWEPDSEGVSTVHSGTVVDEEGNPLGGIRVDLLDNYDLDEKEPDSGTSILDWAYSRSDGSFSVGRDVELPGSVLRLSGRGDLVLELKAIETVGDQGRIAVQTITGQVISFDGSPLSGVSVQLLNWEPVDEFEDAEEAYLGGTLSWGDTNSEGFFAIPVRVPLDVGPVNVSLELLAQSGQSLLETTEEFEPSVSFELGAIQAPAPDENWGDEDLTPVMPDHEAFEHPLG